MKWIRTCQSCGYEQQDTEPKIQGVYTNAYAYRKCKKCGSEDLDYGSNQPSTPAEIEKAKRDMEDWSND